MKVSVLNRFGFALLLTASAVVVMGCGGYKGKADLATCEGTVTYKDAPVEGAKITMTSSQGMASGTTDASGHFKMEVVEAGKAWPGAQIGTLKVAITKDAGGNDTADIGNPPADPNDQAAQEAYMNKALEYQMKKMKEGGGDSVPKSLLPAKYANPTTSGLSVELTKEGKKDIVFALTD